ncbi:hypothetical protein NTGHW29_140113 [Candidatus Nitrotoga sp. HW29]|nr:hypothetical protein NTGHW29_140113 [Candidatus Nitrotoga sp. HW29]
MRYGSQLKSYAMQQSFSGIYPHNKRAHLYLEALAALQNVFDILNDASITQQL